MVYANNLFNQFSKNELHLSTLAWCSFMLIAICYCSLLYTFVAPAPINLIENALWVVREWALWIIISPLIFKALKRLLHQGKLDAENHLKLAFLVLISIVIYQILITYFIDHNNVNSVLVSRLPKHIIALLLIILVWHLKFKTINKKPSTNSVIHDHQQNIFQTNGEHFTQPVEQQYPITNIVNSLMVNKGADKCVISIDDIEAVSAAGNYVEIFCSHEQYLYRSTLKTFQQECLNDKFIQTHRSNVVNIQAIDRIKIQASGSGIIFLKNGKKLNLSKRYKQKLSTLTLAS